MRKLVMLIAAIAILSTGALFPTKAEAGCYRWGETGYHWYRYWPVLTGSTRTGASAGVAIAGIARARKAFGRRPLLAQSKADIPIVASDVRFQG
jgi:hypothetical protein